MYRHFGSYEINERTDQTIIWKRLKKKWEPAINNKKYSRSLFWKYSKEIKANSDRFFKIDIGFLDFNISAY